MPTTKTAIYGARDQAIDLPVPLSTLAISPSMEDLAFFEDRFKEAHLKLYIARTYREALAELSRIRVPVVLSLNAGCLMAIGKTCRPTRTHD